MRYQRTVRRALAIKVAIALVIGAAGVLAPVPTWRTEQAMATATRSPLAEGAIVQPVPDAGSSTTTVVPGVPEESPERETTSTTDTTVSPGATVPPDATGTQDPEVTSTTSSASPPPDVTGGPAARVYVAEDTRDFDLIGVTLPEAPATPVLVRTATDDGVWSEWTELHFDRPTTTPEPLPGTDPVIEPDRDNPGAHSEPNWVGDASRYEIELAAAEAETAQVHLVYETTRDVAVVESAPAGADPSAPPVHSRSAWGARPPTATPTIASSLRLGVVHHTAGTNAYSAAEVPALLRGVQAYHMDANGWNDIGYNFAVDRFGRVWEARAGGVTRAVVGGHARGFNTGSTGVVVLGNFETSGPTAQAVEAVAQVFVWKFAYHDVDPRQPVDYVAGAGSPRYPPGSTVRLNRIVGHRDVGLTACPGQYLYPHLSAIRGAVGTRFPTYAASGVALVGNFAGDAADDVFLRQRGVLPDQLLVARSGGFALLRTYTVGGDYRPVVGDFDGNGYDDIIWYAPGAGSDYLWLSRGDGTFAPVTTSNIGGPYVPIAGDYDGNGADDVLWYAAGPTRDALWLFAGGQYRSVPTPQVAGSYRPAAGDFDGDGDDDVLWYAPGAHGDAIWRSSGGRFTTISAPPVNGTYRPVAGDFDGDSDDDVLWYGVGTRPDNLWLSEGLNFASRVAPRVSGVYQGNLAGDFDNDGGDDVLWYASPGPDAVWWHTSAPFGRSAATNMGMR